ncbi:MAG: sensor histidine kinase [Myxococcota bacterium]
MVRASLVAAVGVLAGGALVWAAASPPATPAVRHTHGSGGVAVALGCFALARHLRGEFVRLARIEDVARRITAGETHLFAAAGRDRAGRIGAAVNELGDELRRRRLDEAGERVFDVAILRETPNGVVVVDRQGIVRRANPAIARILPSVAPAVGRRPIEAFPVPALQEALDEAARAREPAEREAQIDGRDLLIRAFPTADGAGCMGVVLDITSVRVAERARRDFVANVSHELRTPITAIVGYAEILAGEDLPPALKPMVEAMERNARRLGALIEDVLHLSRLEARRGELRLDTEPVRPLIDEVVERFAATAQQKGIRLEVEPFEDTEALLNADAFEHALGNLVDNALKYTPEGGRVSVWVRKGETVDVAVTDTGLGIDPVHHARIFERFYRVDPGRSRDVGGTGLGLALVKHLCLAMGAEVEVFSAEGKGSTFTLKLRRE